MSIEIKKLNYTYMKGTPFEKKALDDVSIEIGDGEFIGLIGHTGSGKSTLIQHINGLLKPESGEIFIDGQNIYSSNVKLSDVRKKVGLIFQYPEYQLFEETVEKDIAYGPKNLGLSSDEVIKRIKRAMELVELSYEKFKDLSPFELSGGEKRRVSIAGIVAMEPKILILDEPTAGLDPNARSSILNNIKKLHLEYKNTSILVSHNIDDIADFSDRVLVMENGRNILFDTPVNVFKNIEMLKDIGLDVPQVLILARQLKKNNFKLDENIYKIKDIVDAIKLNLCGGGY